MTEDLRALALAAIAESDATSDPDYPLFHLAPPVGRLNDPNGLIFRDGVYHACYQFSPFHPHRKLVYWGHASSVDLTHWQQHEPALVPQEWYDRDGVYSGSAIEHDGQVYFAYTGNVRYPDGGRDTHQCLAISRDLVDFEKPTRNPVIPEPPTGYTAHVRDPQVWAEGDGFRMCLGAQREDLTGCALLYSSQDLLTWRFDGELKFPTAEGRYDKFGYMWECPAIIQVPDEVGRKWDVLVFCPQGITPDQEGFENIFPACYLVGELVGTEFTPRGDFHEIDRGFEFYAPQVFANDPTGPVLLAWAGNASEDDQPSIARGWVHLMSLPRALKLRDGRLLQAPSLSFAGATELPRRTDVRLVNEEFSPPELADSRSFALRAAISDTEASSWRIRIGSTESHLTLEFDATTLRVDRSASRYSPAATRVVSLPQGRLPVIELYHDRSITEVFVNGGELAFTMRSYLEPTASGVTFQVNGKLGVPELQGYRFD